MDLNEELKLKKDVEKMRDDDLIQEYAFDFNHSRPLIARAQQAAQQECNNYFQTK